MIFWEPAGGELFSTGFLLPSEFMRYAFLEEPKSPLGKLVSGAWKKCLKQTNTLSKKITQAGR